MTKTALAVGVSSVLSEQKQSNPLKGMKLRDRAKAFILKHPVGSSLTWSEFCEWAHHNGILEQVPPLDNEDTDRRSDEWLAHLQRRHQARANLNKASEHSDMTAYGGAFSVVAQGGVLMVKSTAAVLAQGDVARRVQSLAVTKKKQLDYLYQSTDWSQLPPHERALAEALGDDIDGWVRMIQLQAEIHETKFLKFSNRMKELLAAGTVQPVNGGIKGMMEPPEE